MNKRIDLIPNKHSLINWTKNTKPLWYKKERLTLIPTNIHYRKIKPKKSYEKRIELSNKHSFINQTKNTRLLLYEKKLLTLIPTSAFFVHVLLNANWTLKWNSRTKIKSPLSIFIVKIFFSIL